MPDESRSRAVRGERGEGEQDGAREKQHRLEPRCGGQLAVHVEPLGNSGVRAPEGVQIQLAADAQSEQWQPEQKDRGQDAPRANDQAQTREFRRVRDVTRASALGSERLRRRWE